MSEPEFDLTDFIGDHPDILRTPGVEDKLDHLVVDDIDAELRAHSNAVGSDRPPALYLHCLKTYNAMWAEIGIDDNGRAVYKGFLTRLVTGSLGLSTPTYSHVISSLKAMGCMTSLKRGGGSTPSEWHLIKRPTLELFRSLGAETEVQKAKDYRRGNQTRYERAQNDIVGLTNRINRLEQTLGETRALLVDLAKHVYGDDAVQYKATQALEYEEMQRGGPIAVPNPANIPRPPLTEDIPIENAIADQMLDEND